MKHTTQYIIERLLTLIFKVKGNMYVSRYLELFNSMRKDNGLLYTIKWFKAAKLHITRYMCGKPLHANIEGVSVDKDGFPTRLDFLKPLVHENPRALLTLLSFTRSVEPTRAEEKYREVKVKSIIEPYKGIEYTIPKSFIESFIKINGLNLEKHTYSTKDHYLSMKGSPNGKSSISSLWSLAFHSIDTLSYLKVLVGKDFFDSISKAYTNLWINHRDLLEKKASKNTIGKLSIVHDPELKERVIAMVDYTTQFTLRPIHDQLLNLLSKLPSDRTFTQNPFHSWTKESESQNFYSLDLSSATDRFPIKLQEKLLALLYNDYNYARNWRDLLVDRSYWFDSLELRYSVGQPMGAYTSWAAFTLTHHLVVAWAAKLCGHDNFKDYIILGDDIVIRNNRVAQKYITLMTRWGVEISPSKTHVSKTTYEFAKRWIQNNREISGLSLRGIIVNMKFIHVVYMNIFTYLQRIPYLDVNIFDVMIKLYTGLKVGNRIKSSRAIHNSIYDFHHSIRYTFGLLSYQELRNYLINKIQIDEFIPWLEGSAHSRVNEILSEGIVDQAKALNSSLKSQIFKLEDVRFHKELVKSWPLVHGFSNHVQKLKKSLLSLINPSTDLIEIISEVRLQNLDNVLKFKRNSYENLIMLDKLWKKAFRVYIQKLKKEIDTSSEEFVPKPVGGLVGHIWGIPKSSPFTAYKSTHLGLRTWKEELEININSLDRDLGFFLNAEVQPEHKEHIQDRIIAYVIDCKRKGILPKFDDFK